MIAGGEGGGPAGESSEPRPKPRLSWAEWWMRAECGDGRMTSSARKRRCALRLARAATGRDRSSSSPAPTSATSTACGRAVRSRGAGLPARRRCPRLRRRTLESVPEHPGTAGGEFAAIVCALSRQHGLVPRRRLPSFRAADGGRGGVAAGVNEVNPGFFACQRRPADASGPSGHADPGRSSEAACRPRPTRPRDLRGGWRPRATDTWREPCPDPLATAAGLATLRLLDGALTSNRWPPPDSQRARGRRRGRWGGGTGAWTTGLLTSLLLGARPRYEGAQALLPQRYGALSRASRARGVTFPFVCSAWFSHRWPHGDSPVRDHARRRAIGLGLLSPYA